MAFVLFGGAFVQYGFADLTQPRPVIQGVYGISSMLNTFFGLFYLYISTNDKTSHNITAATRRYYVELLAFAVWVLVFIVDLYAYNVGMIQLDTISWEHHIIINSIVSLTLFLAFLNAVSLPVRIEIEKKVEKQYQEFINAKELVH